MRQREIRYMLDDKPVTVPLDPKMSDDDVFEIARRVAGVIYERTVTDWQAVIIRKASS
jgi:hypothetical protein